MVTLSLPAKKTRQIIILPVYLIHSVIEILFYACLFVLCFEMALYVTISIERIKTLRDNVTERHIQYQLLPGRRNCV